VNLWLNDIAKQNRKLTTGSLQRVKHFLSGVFTQAKNQGFHDDINPVIGAELPPRTAKGKPTHAYNVQQILSIMDALKNDPLALTIVSVAAFAGLQRSEIRGLKWEEYNGEELQVVRAVWESHVDDTKTESSNTENTDSVPVPVIEPLREQLEAWWEKCDKPRQGWMFASENNTPVHLGNLINRNILPVLNGCMICGKQRRRAGKARVPTQQCSPEMARFPCVPPWLGDQLERAGG
jgi:integrase